jgi:hypothetical protein
VYYAPDKLSLCNKMPDRFKPAPLLNQPAQGGFLTFFRLPRPFQPEKN